MADTVTARNIIDNVDVVVVRLTGISDATGETAVKKVDIAAVAKCHAADGSLVQPVALNIEGVRWCIQGYSSVRLLWDHTVDDVALVLSGSGYDDFAGPLGMRGADTCPLLSDPRSSGADGSILLTSAGAAANATYDITLWLRKAAA